ncbi:MAG: HAMP domain-containing sensor histidine kinase [Sulfuricurvum sp.]|nr:HAMP domain-containing sensor histidine kinase [Sulfuricurvum sp.]
MQNEIFSKEVDALYNALPVPLVANFFNTLILVYILKNQISSSALLFWVIANLIIIGFRFSAYYHYRFAKTRCSAHTAYVVYMLGISAAGILWGSSYYFLLPASPYHAMMLLIIIGGMVAGAVGSSSYRPESYIFYNLFVIAPYALYFIFNTSTDSSWMMGITLVLFSVMMIVSSKRFHTNFTDVVLLQLQQEELLKHLEEEKHYADHLNENLLQEIIEKEHYQTDLVVALEEAHQAAIAKDAFFATMSHELRTPLNAIIGFSQILIRRPDVSAELSSYIEKILISGKHLLDLVNTILDFSKMKAGKMELHRSTFSLSELLKDISIMTEPLVQKHSISIQYPSVENVFIEGDRKMIQQILINLLSNAIKFSPENGLIAVTFKSDQNNHFSVCDHGRGIAAEHLESIFDPFSQVKNFTQDALKGTGLGLAIVKEMVHAHGGNIWVESTLGIGSCFEFTIPK